MKKIACFFLIVFLVPPADAQNKKTDSLHFLLQQEKTDTGKIMKLILIGRAYNDAKNDSALFYYTDALNKAQQIKFTQGELSARSNLANFLYSGRSDYANALDLYLQNIKQEEKTGDTAHIFFDTRDVGIIYERIEDFDRESAYINKLKILINSGIFKDSVKLSRYKVVVANRFGGLYDKLNNKDSAKYYKLQAFYYGLNNNDQQWIALGSLGLGNIYRTLNNADSAIYYYRLCAPVAFAIKRFDLYRSSLYGLGNTYWMNKEADSAFYYVQKAFALSQQEKDLNQMMNCAATLAEIYYARNQPDSAYTYLNTSMMLKDSIYGSEKISRIQNLSLKESLQKQQQEQAQKEAVASYKSSVQTYSFMAGLAVLLIVIFILYRNNRQRHIANKKIEKAYHDLKSTQAQLIQSEKMASLGELTAGIAHEIQNPLNFVNNFSDINGELIDELKEELATGNLQLATEIADDIKQNETKINHHGKRADAIVKGMLQHSRSGTGQKEPTDINKLADEYLRLSYHGLRAKDKDFNAAIKTSYDETIGAINIIPQDIGRVLLNLYNNAFYAVNEKMNQATKDLAGLSDYEPSVLISTKKADGKVLISVSDNGNGIPEKIKEKIFQPFFTTKPTGQGTGLGLSLSYDIIKAQGGEITVDSKEGAGTEFIIMLPAKE